MSSLEKKTEILYTITITFLPLLYPHTWPMYPITFKWSRHEFLTIQINNFIFSEWSGLMNSFHLDFSYFERHFLLSLYISMVLLYFLILLLYKLYICIYIYNHIIWLIILWGIFLLVYNFFNHLTFFLHWSVNAMTRILDNIN